MKLYESHLEKAYLAYLGVIRQVGWKMSKKAHIINEDWVLKLRVR